MTGNHQVKKSSGIPTHQTIKNRSAMNSAMVFPIPQKNTATVTFPFTAFFLAHLCFLRTFFSTQQPFPCCCFLWVPEAAVDSLGQLSTLEIAHAAFAEARAVGEVVDLSWLVGDS